MAEFGKNWAKSANVDRNQPKVRLGSSHCGAKRLQIRGNRLTNSPTTAEFEVGIGRTSPKIGPDLAKSAQVWSTSSYRARVQPTSRRAGQLWMRPHFAEVGQEARSGRSRPKLVKVQPKSAEIAPNVVELGRPKLGPNMSFYIFGPP